MINVNIPNCVKVILSNSGYDDNSFGISNIDDRAIFEIEDFTNDGDNQNIRKMVDEINCCYAQVYRESVRERKFKFLPGHRSLHLCVADKISQQISSKEAEPGRQVEHLLNQLDLLEPPLWNHPRAISSSSYFTTGWATGK